MSRRTQRFVILFGVSVLSIASAAWVSKEVNSILLIYICIIAPPPPISIEVQPPENASESASGEVMINTQIPVFI